MEKVIVENGSLETILDTICNGFVGFEDGEDHSDLVITNKNDALFKGIVIKPIIVNIMNDVLAAIAQENIKIDSLETMMLDFVVFTTTIEEDEDGNHKHVLVNQSLAEYIMMMKKANIDLLQTTGWHLTLIK